MNIINLKVVKNDFTGTVLKGKNQLTLEGSFRTSFQDYPQDKDMILYASTINFTLTDKNGKQVELSEIEHRDFEEILEEKVDEFLEANSSSYSK